MRDRHNFLRDILPIAASTAAMCLISATSLPAKAFAATSGETATPIQHLVVIFQENVSFDHYFGTYPTGLNPSGEPRFVAKKGTPSVNGLGTLVDGEPDGVLLTDNPTANNLANGSSAINPFRLAIPRHRPATRITITATSSCLLTKGSWISFRRQSGSVAVRFAMLRSPTEGVRAW